MNRPMVWVAASFAAGTWVAGMGWCPGLLPPILLFLAGLGFLAISRGPAWRSQTAIVLLFAAAGALLWTVRHTGPPADSLQHAAVAHPGARYHFTGRVRSALVHLPGTRYTRAVVDVERAWLEDTPRPVSGRVLLQWQNPAFPLHPGERIRFEGKVNPYLGPVNHDLRGYEDHLRAKGVFTRVTLRGDAVEKCGGRLWSPAYWASRLRTWEGRLLSESMPEPVRPFAIAVWLGDRQLIEPELYQQFVDSGTAHVLAVSGVHMGIIFLSVNSLLRMLVKHKRARTLTVMGVVLLFALVTGARIPGLRAAIMVVLYLTADLFDREPDAPTALGLSGMLFLLLNPNDLFEPGFLASYLSVASILLFAAWLSAFLEWIPWWFRGNVTITLAVHLLPMPVMLHFFHTLPLCGPPVNLVVVPLLAVTLWLCFLTTLCGALVPPLAPLFGYAAWPVVALIDRITHSVASVPGTHLSVVSPTAAAACCYWVATGCLAFALFRYAEVRANPHARDARRDATSWLGHYVTVVPPWKRWAMGTALFMGLAWLFWQPAHLPATVDFLDVGHADAAFVRTPGGSTVLIDGGRYDEFGDAGRRVVVPFLYANACDRLDYAVATHPDSDHMGGLLYVLERMRVGALLLGPVEKKDDDLEKELLVLCGKRGVPVARLARGDIVRLDGATLEVLHPPRDWHYKNDNETSLVLRLRWPGIRVLFAADVERHGERLLAEGDCAADVLKVPHHGSATSSTPVFLDAVAPQHAVFSTRESGRLRATGRGILERYQQRDIRIWRTDHDGGIRLQWPEGKLAITGARPVRGYSLVPR